ncbi:hypothetical protein [Microvirga soli]|uniref:hypothetical protein n=1 Tax=Microvirga soli TaxID=1854496 RepID=UPI00191EFEE8|nr:hypothetical protein [Microvirga soli]
MKPQERPELAKHRELEAINARPTHHERLGQLILLLVVAMGVVIIGLLAYHLLDHA